MLYCPSLRVVWDRHREALLLRAEAIIRRIVDGLTALNLIVRVKAVDGGRKAGLRHHAVEVAGFDTQGGAPPTVPSVTSRTVIMGPA